MVAVLKMKNRAMFLAEVLLSAIAVLICTMLRFRHAQIAELLVAGGEFGFRVALYSAIFAVSIFLNDLYHIQVIIERRAFLYRLAQTNVVSVLLYALVGAVIPEQAQGRVVFALSLILANVFLVTLYKVVNRFSDSRPFLERILVLGNGRIASVIRTELQSGNYRHILVDDQAIERRVIEDIVQAGQAEAAAIKAIHGLSNYADLIVIALESEVFQIESRAGGYHTGIKDLSTPQWTGRTSRPSSSGTAASPLRAVDGIYTRAATDQLVRESVEPFLNGLIAMKLRGVKIALGLDYYQELTGRVFLGSPHDPMFFLQSHFKIDKPSFLIKIIWEKVLAAIMFVCGIPFLLIVPLAIWIDSGRPLLFVQPRVGQGGRVFKLYKWRSMNDQGQVTRVGRIIRATKTDELPQLINVLRGEMSLVGPRPELPQIVEGFRQMTTYYDLRHMVRPGLAGWAQIMFPDAKAEHALVKLSYDLYYVKHFSLISDIVIMMETFKMIVFGGMARIARLRQKPLPSRGEEMPSKDIELPPVKTAAGLGTVSTGSSHGNARSGLDE